MVPLGQRQRRDVGGHGGSGERGDGRRRQGVQGSELERVFSAYMGTISSTWSIRQVVPKSPDFLFPYQHKKLQSADCHWTHEAQVIVRRAS